MSDAGFIILILSVLALAVSILLLSAELRSTKRTQRASIALQLAQQLQDPSLQHAMQALQTRMNQRTVDSAPANGHMVFHDDIHHERDTDVATVVRYFGQVGDLVHQEIVGPEIITLLGPIISEQWHITRALGTASQQDLNSRDLEHFAYLYTEWLNYDYAQRELIASSVQHRHGISR